MELRDLTSLITKSLASIKIDSKSLSVSVFSVSLEPIGTVVFSKGQITTNFLDLYEINAEFTINVSFAIDFCTQNYFSVVEKALKGEKIMFKKVESLGQ